MHEPGRRREGDGKAALAGGQAKSQTDMGLSSSTIAESDDVITGDDIFAARQFQHEHLVEAGDGGEVERVEAFYRRESRGADPPFHRAALAVDEDILCINVESEPELELLSSIAAGRGRAAPISVRVNPDIDPKTHHKIATGKAENKFGIPISRAREVYAHAAKLPGVAVTGVDMHIGSQITHLQPFEDAFARVVELIATLRADGHTIARADLGGGLGVPYTRDNQPPPDPAAYGAMIAKVTKGLNAQLIFEPGRLIAANAGILVSRVIYDKEGEAKRFLIIDAGMNDLIRPAMYDAHHDIVSVAGPGNLSERYDVVGPVCETSDLFARDCALPPMKAGDLVAILSAGAYGAVMASAYNARPPAPEVLVKGGAWSIVRPRLSEDALVEQDHLPNWLEG